jgi:hypothetical protein
MSDLAIHLAGDCAPGCPVCAVEDADRSDARCGVCDGGFTVAEWFDRHTGPGPEHADVHAECCGQCQVEDSRPQIDRRSLRFAAVGLR